MQKPKARKPAESKDGESVLTRRQAAHHDGEASWTQKPDLSYFGYKSHINADVAHDKSKPHGYAGSFEAELAHVPHPQAGNAAGVDG